MTRTTIMNQAKQQATAYSKRVLAAATAGIAGGYYWHRTNSRPLNPTVAASSLSKNRLPLRWPWINANYHIAQAQTRPSTKRLPKARPDDRTHIYFSVQAYEDNGGIPLTGWKLIRTHLPTQQSDETGYFGAAYVNEEAKHIIIAHRGTDGPDVKDWVTNFTLILNRLDKQEAKAWAFAEPLIQDYVIDKGYSVSFAGHSLGGWLAQVCLFFYETKFPSAPDGFAVTLDDPGSRELLEALRSRVEPSLPIDKLDITGYLSCPNSVNTALTHVGTNYALCPPLNLPWWKSQTLAWTLAAHDKQALLDYFPTVKEAPKKLRRINDWPRLDWGFAGHVGFTNDTQAATIARVIFKWAKGEINRNEYTGLWKFGQKRLELPNAKELGVEERVYLEQGNHYQVEDYRSSVLPLRNMPVAIRHFLNELFTIKAESRLQVIQDIIGESHFPSLPFKQALTQFKLQGNGYSDYSDLIIEGTLSALEFRDQLQRWLYDHPMLTEQSFFQLTLEKLKEGIGKSDYYRLLHELLPIQKAHARRIWKNLSFRYGTARLYKYNTATKTEIQQLEDEINDIQNQLESVKNLANHPLTAEQQSVVSPQMKDLQRQLKIALVSAQALLAYSQRDFVQTRVYLNELLKQVDSNSKDGKLIYNRAYNLKAKMAAVEAKEPEGLSSEAYYEKALEYLPKDAITSSNYAGRLTDIARDTENPALDVKSYQFYEVALEHKDLFQGFQRTIVLSSIVYGWLRLASALDSGNVGPEAQNLPSAKRLREKAELLLKEILDNDTSYSNTHLYLAVLKYDTEQYEDALKGVDNALACNPSYPTALVRKGRILFALRRMDEAQEYLLEARGYFMRHLPEMPDNQKKIDEIDKILKNIDAYKAEQAKTASTGTTNTNTPPPTFFSGQRQPATPDTDQGSATVAEEKTSTAKDQQGHNKSKKNY